MKAPADSSFFRYAKYFAVAFEFIGSIAAGVFLGSALDAWLLTAPWLVIAMTIASTVVGFYRMVQILQRLQRTR
ncbi:MAG: AtpZ/AtpI family protein [Deltaproteobacteria bacterium]|nr:AtpZ/AtpI family protein [Deltaproteobacteria bacterium]